LTAGLLTFTTNSVYAPCLVGVTDCGPPPGVTVSTWTDSQFYEKNDTINLKGKLYVENYTNPIQVQIINPTNMTVQTLETFVNNNMFSVKINANFNDSGMYQIITCVKSWCDRSYFKYTAEPYHLSFNGGNYLIWYKSIADLQKIDVDVGAQALRVYISGATAEGLQFVITLPRDLIDFQSARGDQNFTVLVGAQQPDKYMQPASFKEIATNSLSRTLAIDIPYKPISDVQGIWDFKITGSDVLSGPSIFSAPPLEQFKSGIKVQDVKCNAGFELVIKSTDGSPACVKPETAQKLVERGWAISPTDLKPWVKIDTPSLNNTYVVNQPISFSVTVKGFGNYPCVSPQIKIHDNKNSNVPVFQDNGSTMSCPALRTSDNYSFDFPGNNSQYVIILNKTGDYAMTISYGDNSVQKYFSVVLPSNPKSITILENNAGIVLLKSQTYYFETPNYTNDAYAHPVQVSFHDVFFTLFPPGFRGGLPSGGCMEKGPGLGQYYWTDAKFADDIHELLHIFADSPSCTGTIPSMFSNHANPQAGLTFYNGKMKLLVGTKNTLESSTRLHPIDIVSIQFLPTPPNPGGPTMQVTLTNIGMTPVTNLNATLALNNNYVFNFKDVTESNPLAPGHSTSDTEMLIGVGSTEMTYPLTVVGTENNKTFSYTLNVHIPYTNENEIIKIRR